MRLRDLAFQLIGEGGLLYFGMSWRADTALDGSPAIQG